MPPADRTGTELQRIGGVSALVASATFVIGIVLFATSLSDYTTGDPTPAESVEFLADNEALMYAWNIVIFIVFGVALVPLVMAVHQLTTPRAPSLATIAGAFGLIWAGLVIAAGMIANVGWGTVVDLSDEDPDRATSLWEAVDSVQNGVGGGNEIAGGIWVLLASWAALQAATLPRNLCGLGMVAGAAGLVTVLPGLEAVGAVFGLGLIAWFGWAGIILLRTSPPEEALGGPGRP